MTEHKRMTLEERSKEIVEDVLKALATSSIPRHDLFLSVVPHLHAVELAAFERCAAIAEELMVDVHDSFGHAFKEGARCCRNEISALASGGNND